MMKADRNLVYQIKVQGKVNEAWSDWLAGLAISYEQANKEMVTTTLTGAVLDQAGLRGILNKLWDLNVRLLSVKMLDQLMIGGNGGRR